MAVLEVPGREHALVPAVVRALAALLLAGVTVNAGAQSILTVAGGGPIGDGQPATKAILRLPEDLVFDASGNMFIADNSNNRVRRVDAVTGVITTYAGGGTSGVGDGGPATSAEVYPADVIFDRQGNLLIADGGSVRKVDRITRVITTIAGGGSEQPAGVPATSASLCASAITMDSRGDLFIACAVSVYRVSAQTGLVDRYAGNGERGYGGDGGPALGAKFDYIRDLEIDPQGNLVIADTYNGRVRRVDAGTRLIATIAGGGPAGFYEDGLLATEVEMYPDDIAYDAAGNLYDLAGSALIRIDRETNRVLRIAGIGDHAFAGDGGPAVAARFNFPYGIAIDGQGNLYVADSRNHRIRRINASDSIINTVAGAGPSGADEGGPATSASLFTPYGVTSDSHGNLYVAEEVNYRVRRVEAATGAIRTWAGIGAPGFVDGGPATQTPLYEPWGLAVDGDDNLFIAARLGNIWKVDKAGLMTRVAGDARGHSGYDGDGGLATLALINHAEDVAVDAQGNLFIADTQNHRIRKVTAATGVITTIAGSGPTGGDGVFAGDGGPATEARLFVPGSIEVDASGNVYVADEGNVRVRRIEPATGIIRTIAGGGNPCEGIEDGVLAVQVCLGPKGIDLDRSGNLLINNGDMLFRLELASGRLYHVAGVGPAGYTGDGGPAKNARLSGRAVEVDARGNVFIADTYNNRVRAVSACVPMLGPGLVEPANNAANLPTAVTLRWNPVPGAFRYEVRLGIASNFPPVIASDVTTTSYTVSNLVPGQAYRWRIAAKGDPFCPNPSTAFSEVRTLTVGTGCTAPGPFVLQSPPDNATGLASPVTLAWAAASGASSYDVYFGTTNPPPLHSTTSATSLPVAGLVAGTSYYWNVVARASCDSTLATATPVRRFALAGGCAIAGAFAQTEPADGATSVPLTAHLAWTASSNASGYDLYLGTTNPPPVYLFDLSPTSLDVQGLFQGRTYYWRVVARTACDPTKNVATPVRTFMTAGTCATPGATEIVFVPPGSVGVGQTYVLAWSDAPSLDADGYYELQRSPAADFSNVTDTQLTANTVAAFVPVATGTFHHRVRAIAGCDTTRAGPWSASRSVTVSGGTPNVIFTVHPEAVITNLGEKLEDKVARFTLENISNTTQQVIVGKAEINSAPFFTVTDPLGGDAVFVTLDPRVAKSFELRFSGPPNDQPASYQGLVLVSAPGAPIVPYAFVNLKVGSAAAATPRFKVAGVAAEYAFFPGFSGDDAARPSITVTVENPGASPMELGAEISPEVWLVPEAGWNSTPIPARGSRDVRLSTQRGRAPNGSALPRYTYFTVRTRTGEKARLLVQDNDGTISGSARTPLPTPETRSYVVPEVVSGASVVSRLRLTNAGSGAVQVSLVFTPTGADGFDLSSIRSVAILVPPNDVVTLTDPLRQLFGLSGGGSGSIEVRGAPEKIGLITVTSAHVAPDDATRLLAAIPVAWRGEGSTADEDHVVPAVTRSTTRRTALGLVETTGIDMARVRLTLTDAQGATKGSKEVLVSRYGRVELADVVNELAPSAALSAASLTVDVIDGGGSVLAVGRTTGAAGEPVSVFVGRARTETGGAKIAALNRRAGIGDEKISLARQVLLVPVVLHGKLSFSATVSYRTTIGFVASKEKPAAFSATLREAGGQSYSATVSVPAGETREYADVVTELFGIASSLQGTMSIGADPGASVYASISTLAAGGTELASSTGVTALAGFSDTLTSSSPQEGKPLLLDGLEQSIDLTRGLSWSVYLSEIRGRSGVVTIRLYEAGNRSSPIAEKDFTIGAAAQLRLETIFAAMGLDSLDRRKDRTNVLIVVSPKSGQALIAASALAADHRTGQVQYWTLTPSGGMPASASLAGAYRPVERRRPVRQK